MIATLIAATYGTSLISGMFAMAGGVILMGVYSVLLPVSIAMLLHGFVQTASNGFRSWLFREHIHWPTLPWYMVGSAISLAICFYVAFIPEKYVVFLFLGGVAMLSIVTPSTPWMRIEQPKVATTCGFLVTIMQIISGVSGPLLDIFYLNSRLDRYEVMATKSMTQTVGHIVKLAYYGTLLEISLQDDFTLPYWVIPFLIGVTFLGARSGKFLLHYINDHQFRRISRYLVFILGVAYVIMGIDAYTKGSL